VSELSSDPIFAALTRPQMIAGITYNYAVFNLIVSVEAFLITRSFWVIAVAGAIHAAGYLGCLHEPRFFDLWITRVSRCPRVRNYRYWGANAYQP
jgi:type IV secretion system protein VirB3